MALIDFDAAAPGSRVYDLGYAAWMWLDLGSDAYTPQKQADRFKLFVDAYGDLKTQAVVDAMLLRQAIVASQGHARGYPAMAAWALSCKAWTQAHRAVLEGDAC